MATPSPKQIALLKGAYKLGFEIGYHAHDEFYGWVDESKKKLEWKANELGVLRAAAMYYKRGKVAGSTKAIKDRANDDGKSTSERWKLYEKLVEKAWSDDAMTADEEAVLKVINRDLALGKKDFATLTETEKERIYRDVLIQVWDDGVVTEEEQDILENLGERLGIAMSTMAEINVDVRKLRQKERDAARGERSLGGGACSSTMPGDTRTMRCGSCNTQFRTANDSTPDKCPKCGNQC